MPVLDKIEKLTDRKKRAAVFEYALYFAAGFLLSFGSVLGSLKPFGISLVSVSKKKCFVFSMCGALVALILRGIDENSARYLAGVGVAALGAFAAASFDLNKTPSFGMLLAFLSSFLSGVALNVKLSLPLSAYVLTTGEALLTSGGAFFLYKSLNSSYKQLRLRAIPMTDLTCIIISFCMLLMSLSAVKIGFISPVEILGVAAVLVSVRFGGERIGVIISLCLGFVLGISNNSALFLVGAFGFSALLSLLFSTLSNFAVGAAFLCSASFFCIFGGDFNVSFFSDALIGTLIFVFLPRRIKDKIEGLFDRGNSPLSDGSLRQNLVLKLRVASSAMAAISESVDTVRERINEITRRENDCKRSELTKEEYIRREIVLEKTNQIRMVASDQFFSISDMLEDLAFEFDEAEIFDAVAANRIRRLLSEYDIFPISISALSDKYSRMRVEILTEGMGEGLENPEIKNEIGKICARYFDKGKITSFKNETMLSFFERPNYSLEIGFSQHSAEGALCGDTVKVINDNKGRSILIISDGMGKGSRAALDGAMGAGLLSKLINAGFGFDSALKVVNSALLVKSNDESLATLDVANLDLFTGKCELLKAGAPASYIIKGESVTKCELTSMPAGILRGVEFAKRTAVLSPDDFIVLMSDGVSDLGDKWLFEMFREAPDLSPQAFCDYVIDEALKISENTKRDDMSIIAAKLNTN